MLRMCEELFWDRGSSRWGKALQECVSGVGSLESCVTFRACHIPSPIGVVVMAAVGSSGVEASSAGPSARSDGSRTAIERCAFGRVQLPCHHSLRRMCTASTPEMHYDAVD